jgi:hypothetical protein
LKTRCSRQIAQCDASLERRSFSGVLDVRTAGRGDERSADEALCWCVALAIEAYATRKSIANASRERVLPAFKFSI